MLLFVMPVVAYGYTIHLTLYFNLPAGREFMALGRPLLEGVVPARQPVTEPVRLSATA